MRLSVPSPAFQQRAMVSAARQYSARSSSIAEESYAPGTLLQAGPGVPRWRYVAYPFAWSGPVESAQTVRFMVLRPWLVSLWRVLGVALLALLFTRLARGSLDATPIGRRWFSTRPVASRTIEAETRVCYGPGS